MAQDLSAAVVITAETDGFEAGLKDASAGFEKFARRLRVVSNNEGQATGKALGGGLKTEVAKSVEGLKDEFDRLGSISRGGFSAIASNFTSLVTNPVTLAAASIGASLFAAFNLSRVAEQNEAVGRSFARFATQANLNAEALKSGIAEAIAGFGDLNDALPRANAAILALGDNANRLPEIFSLARKISAETGRELTDVFDDLTKGIQTGNEKALRGVLINIDAKKAQEDYAASLGTTVENLSDAGKQAAVLNAVIAQGSKDFQESQESATPLGNSIRELGLAWKDFVGVIENSLIASGIRDFFATVISGSAAAIQSLNGLISGSGQAASEVEAQITSLQEKITGLTLAAALDPTNAEALKATISGLNAEIDRLRAGAAATPAQEIGGGLAASDAVVEKAAENNAKIIENEIAAAETLRQLQAEQDIARLERIALETGQDTELQAARNQARIDDINATADAELQKVALIEDANERIAATRSINAKRALDLTKETNKQEIDAEKKKIAERKALQEAALASTSAILSAASQLARQGSREAKALGVADAIVNTYRGANLALASSPPPFNFIQAAAVIASGLANVRRITAANDGALVTRGKRGLDTEPFLLSKGEVVVPERNFEEMFAGIAAQRGLIRRDEAPSATSQTISVNVSVQGDVLDSDAFIDRVGAGLRDAIQFRDLRLES